jgi:hypothetical protein
VVSKSKHKAIIDPLQLKSDADVLYMPAWTCDELILCNRLINYNTNSSEISRRYELYGGIPRFIFSEKQEAIKWKLSEALQKSEIMNNLDLIKKQS